MNSKYNALFTPWKIGNVEIPNRIVQCSMGGTSLFGWMEPSHLDKEAAYFLLNRAQDGVGLILPGMQCIKDPIGGRWLYQNNKMFKDLKEYMVEFHKTGSKLFIQLAAGMGRSMAITKPMVALLKHPILGKLASPVADLDYITASASATPNRWYDEIKSRPMTIKEIHDQVEAFAKTSKKLMDAGVDGVEIHAVHEGYLLDQFTISNMNYRTDEYGGSFENRFRFPVEIVQAIKAACGDDFPVSLRYSVVSKTKDWGKGAMPYEKDFKEFGRDMEESEKAIKYLADAGYDMFNCDNGTYDAWYWAHPPQYMPDNCNLEYVEHIKKFTDKPVVCAGRMDPVKAAEEIEAGKLDAVAIARQNLVDHDWIHKIKEGHEDEIKPCIRCHNGCFNMAKFAGTPNVQHFNDSMHLARCALNPTTMQHTRYKIVPTKNPKKVAIIGGGGGPVIHRGVGHVHAGELTDHGLILEDGLQQTLAHFRLIGGVGREELLLGRDIFDDGGDVVVIGPCAPENGGVGAVFGGHGGHRPACLQLAHAVGDVQGLPQEHLLRHIPVQIHDVFQPHGPEHLLPLGLGGGDIAAHAQPSSAQNAS